VADTNTPNILLLLPDTGDTFNFPLHVENNFSVIDGLMGAVDCTSTTRPSNTYKGQVIFEHDSGRYVQNTGSKASPVWTYMSHAAESVTNSTHPTSGLTSGLMIYETDTKYLQVWNGSAWEQKAFSNLTCTSSAHPSVPFTGLEIYETDTGMSAVYNGSTYSYSSQQAAATQVLGGTTASITFSSVSSKYTNVTVYWSARDTNAALSDSLLLRFNGDTGNNYGYQYVEGQGTTAQAASGAMSATSSITIGKITGASATASYYSGGRFDVLGWNKSASGRNAVAVGVGYVTGSNTTTGQLTGSYGGGYVPAAQLSSLTLLPSAGSFAAGSQFSLYAEM